MYLLFDPYKFNLNLTDFNIPTFIFMNYTIISANAANGILIL